MSDIQMNKEGRKRLNALEEEIKDVIYQKKYFLEYYCNGGDYYDNCKHLHLHHELEINSFLTNLVAKNAYEMAVSCYVDYQKDVYSYLNDVMYSAKLNDKYIYKIHLTENP